MTNKNWLIMFIENEMKVRETRSQNQKNVCLIMSDQKKTQLDLKLVYVYQSPCAIIFFMENNL